MDRQIKTKELQEKSTTERSGTEDPHTATVKSIELEEIGWIAEADADYGIFVVTASGIEEATS